MVRNYVKKTNRKTTSPSKLERASVLLKNNWSARAAARQLNISRQALWRYVNKQKKDNQNLPADAPYKPSHVSRQIFSMEQEQTIVTYCIQVAKMGYGLTVMKVRELAFEVATENNLKFPTSWEKNNLAGIDWYQGFMKRHSDQLSIRTPEACSIARAMAFNRPTVEKYYDKLEEVLRRHPSFQDGSRVYNLDETSTSTVQNTKKLVSPKGIKQVHQIKTAERGVSVTTCIIIAAHGFGLPPVMIFPRKVFKSNMLIGAFPGTVGLANDKGYNTKETFYEVMKHFINCTKSSKENPTLLLLDNVETHFSTATLDLAKDNGVVVFTFPPHCTHKLQPLDVGFFGPFKTYYNNAIHSFILNNPSVPITIYHIAGFVNEAYLKSASPNTIISSFQKPGICPFNRHVFEESDFIMASVTEQPLPGITPAVSGTQDSAPTASGIEDVDRTETVFDSSQSQEEPESSVVTVNTTASFRGPSEVRGYPHAKPKETTRKPRRKGKSMVATDTPEKQAITERENEVLRKKNLAEERKRKREDGMKNKKVQKKSGGKTVPKKTLFLNETDTERGESDSSSVIDDVSTVSTSDTQNMNVCASEGDYVLVCLKGKNPTHFVGKIIKEKDEDGDLDISYMKKLPGSPIRFVLPTKPALHSIHVSDVVSVLPKPSYPANVTERQKSKLSFQYNFGDIRFG